MKIKKLLLAVPLFLLASCVKESAALSGDFSKVSTHAQQNVKHVANMSAGNVAVNDETEEKYRKTVEEIRKLTQEAQEETAREATNAQSQLKEQFKSPAESMEKLVNSQSGSQAAQEQVKTEAETAATETVSGSQVQQEKACTINLSEGVPLVPPNAKPGECFAIGYLPPKYAVEKVRVEVDEGGEKVITKPPVYRVVEKRVLVRPATEKIITVPPVYKTVREKVLVRPATEKVVVVKPAVYKWVTEKVMVEPPRTVWKRGESFLNKAIKKKWDPKTGDILCLVEVPAKYKYIRKRVMVEPPVTKKVVIPPEYKYVEKQVLVKPATTKVIKLPPVYKTVKVKELVEPARVEKVVIPPKYAWVDRRVQVRGPQYLWVKVLCKTNMTPEMIRKLQVALKKEGYYDGPIDGIWGAKTQRAVVAYQKDHDLPITPGAVTLKMLKMLNLSF
ncbi:peptidoglycan-binding protein [Thermovibrio ammonificans]|jgi:hypothetical protein